MNLHALLLERKAAGRPVTVGLIGAGKFGTMFLSQARLTEGMQIVGVADLNVARAKEQLKTAGWPAEQYAARSLDDALKQGGTLVTADADALIAHDGIEVIVEATGVPGAGIRHALAAIAHGKHIVMVNVEADALAGPLLARKAKEAGVVYSLAWGDQPALICEHVDWARAAGFKVIAAGKGTRYEPHYHQSNPGQCVGHSRQVSQDRRPQFDQSENVQLVRRRHQVRHRDDGGVQRDGPRAAERRPGVPACDTLRTLRCVQAESRGRHAGEGRRHRSHLVGLSRRARRAASSGARHLRGDRGRDRVRAPLLQGIRDAAGHEREVRGALPADPHDRVGARHFGRVGRAAQGSQPARRPASARMWWRLRRRT